MKTSYCDLHCDTPLELYFRGYEFESADLNINGKDIKEFENYLQICAYCAPWKRGDSECYDIFYKVTDSFKKQVSDFGGRLCLGKADIAETEHGVPGFILSIEDGRILDGDITRLDELFDYGVRVMTPLWGGETCVGGSHESEAGLTSFGHELAKRCGELGIITDISHASAKSADEIIASASAHGMPVIASHSCSAELYPHTRNLTDRQAKAVAETGGIIGVNSYPVHVTGGESHLSDVVRHISHFVSVIGEDKVSLGMDFDGMGTCLTRGLEGICHIPCLSEEMKKAGFSEDVCEKILYKNAFEFLKRNIADPIN